MDYSIAAQHLAHDPDGVLFDVGSLYAYLLQVPDPRHRQGRRYALALILLLIVLAKLGGADTPSAIAEWARARAGLIVQAFQLPRPSLPSHNTYRRILGQVVPAATLEQWVSRFLAQLPQTGPRVHLALDGKSLRGSIAWGQCQGVHLLAAYVPAQGVTLIQVAVAGKENELTAAPRVLNALDLQGQIVTGDAMFAQRGLSQQVRAAGGHYVWTVKANQPQLYADIAELFAPSVRLGKGFNTGPSDFRQARTVNTGHGRLETRTLTASGQLNQLSDWPGLAQVFRVARHVQHPARGTTRQEVVYGVTSLSAQQAPPARLLQWVRQHWGIENGLHYRRDVTFHEDATRTRSPNCAQALAALHNLVLGLLLHAGHTNLARARRHFAAHPDEALRLLLTRPS